MRRPTCPSSSTPAKAWPRSVSARRSCHGSASARRSAATRTSAHSRSRAARWSIPGRYFAGLADAADRAGADLHEGVRATIDRPACDGVSSSRRSAAPSGPATSSSPRTATRTGSSLAPPADHPDRSYIIATEPLPEDLAHELSPKGRAFFDTKNFLYYWHVSADRRMVFGGRASFMPTSVDRTARDPAQGSARGPSAARRPSDRVRVGRQRRVHLRPDAARRTDQGRRHVRGRLLRDGGRADDPPRDAGGGMAGGRRRRRHSRDYVPARPAPYEGRPWFMPVVGEWYRCRTDLPRGPATRHSARDRRDPTLGAGVVGGAADMSDTIADLLATVPLLVGAGQEAARATGQGTSRSAPSRPARSSSARATTTGWASSSCRGRGGRDRRRQRGPKVGPGSYFGEVALISDRVRTATVTAATDCHAWS